MQGSCAYATPHPHCTALPCHRTLGALRQQCQLARAILDVGGGSDGVVVASHRLRDVDIPRRALVPAGPCKVWRAW